MKQSIADLSRKAGIGSWETSLVLLDSHDTAEAAIVRFAGLIAAAEREECARLAEDLHMSDGDWIAKQIRERK